MNIHDISVSSEGSSSYNSDFFKEDIYGNHNNQEKFRIYKSIIKELKLRIISNPEETLSIEKQIRKQSLFSKNNIFEYKFFVVGDHSSGKTSFCLKFSKKKFNLEIKPSTEIDCYLKTLILFGKELKIYLIDFNEDLLTKNIPNNLYSDIKGVFVLYDVTKNKNFDKTIKIIENLKEKIGNVIPLLLVGNKTDLKNLKVMNLEEVKNKTKKFKCEYKESNCIEENSVDNVIKYFVSSIYYNDLDDIEKEEIKNNIINKENIRIKNNQNI